jgi:hypothetical protein
MCGSLDQKCKEIGDIELQSIERRVENACRAGDQLLGDS